MTNQFMELKLTELEQRIEALEKRPSEKMKPHSWYCNKENPNSSWMICSNCMATLDRNTDWIFCPKCGDPKDKEDESESNAGITGLSD